MMNYKIISTTKLPLPILSLQITQGCNLACLHCDFQRGFRENKNSRPLHMSSDLFENVLGQYARYEQTPEKYITLSVGGEPMFHPKFLDLAKRVDIAGITFGFDTNATKLDTPTIKALLEMSSFKRIIFSIDGASSKVYESIRVGAKLEQVKANVLNFLRLAQEYGRTDIISRVNMVLQEQNQEEANDIIEFWTPKVAQVNISVLRVGTKFVNPNWMPDKRVACNFPTDYMRVLTDGSVVVCVIDDNYVSTLGSLKDNSLEDIWNGLEYQKLRASHNDGNYGYLQICEDCDAWAGRFQANEHKQFSPTITLGIRPANIIAFQTKPNPL
jgi:MoaA/NifB/PqqE/SkfB family radical SAM enzyme